MPLLKFVYKCLVGASLKKRMKSLIYLLCERSLSKMSVKNPCLFIQRKQFSLPKKGTDLFIFFNVFNSLGTWHCGFCILKDSVTNSSPREYLV